MDKKIAKNKKDIVAMGDNYWKLWDLKDEFRNEKDRLTEENATLKTLVDNKNDAITVLDNESKTLKKLLEEKTVLKVSHSSVPTQEFGAEAIEDRPDYGQIDGSCFATDDEIKTMMINKCVEKICDDMMHAGAFDIREDLTNDFENCCKKRRITVKARAVVFSK